MTRAELGLTAFIFALIYSAGFLPGLGRFLGRLFSGRSAREPESGPGSPEDGASGGAPSTDLPETREPR